MPDDDIVLKDGRHPRFFSPLGELSPHELTYFTAVDHRDHEAIGASADSGEGVAVARYVRTEDQPAVAEIALTVADAWQGVGRALLERLAERAGSNGVHRFTALILGENTPMPRLMERIGEPVSRTRDGDTVGVVVDIDGG